jgi:hypothetical protein
VLGNNFHICVQTKQSCYETTYLGKKLHTLVKNTYLGTKLHASVLNYKPYYKTIYPSRKLHTSIPSYIPWYKTSYLGTKQLNCIQNYLPEYKTTYLGTKLLTWVQNTLTGYKTTYLGAKLHTYTGPKLNTRLWKFLPGCQDSMATKYTFFFTRLKMHSFYICSCVHCSRTTRTCKLLRAVF